MHVLLIDGLNLIRRVHAGVPRLEDSDKHNQTLENACENSLRRALRYHQPSHVICAMDTEEPSWRDGIFPDYKKNRRPMPDDLRLQLVRIISRFNIIGVGTVSVDGFEADDLIASIARKVVEGGGSVTILSTDKSFCQLASDRVHVYDHFSSCRHDENYIREKFGVDAPQLVDLFALAGDRSLNIPGARGIGLRTAAKLIREYGDLEAVLLAVENNSLSWAKKIRSSEQSIKLSRCLVRLRSDVSIGVNLRHFRLN